ncbi:MAG: hypothetical protein ACI8RZ_000032 [Myxococcota bacterium]|jgi:hypothetical protein
MTSKSDRHLIVLLSLVVAADAGPEGPSIRKRRAMQLVLRSRFPDRGYADVQKLIAKANTGMPAITSGLDIMKITERQAEKLAATLPAEEREEALLTILDVAAAVPVISAQSERILRVIARTLDLSERLPAAA